MADAFQEYKAGLTAPIEHAEPVVPDDNDNLEHRPRSIWVGTAGDLAVLYPDGFQATYTNVTVGRHPIRPIRVLATGTTATGIVAEW